MSYPGILPVQPVRTAQTMSEDPNTVMAPEFLQQLKVYQDQQKRQALAQSLMQNNAQGQNSGLANAGSSILGALTAKNMQNQADPENSILQQRYGISGGAANDITHPSMLSKLFNLGGQ